MAKTEVVCPFCKAVQTVPDKRLHDAWVCMKCRGTIDDPFLHKKKAPPPKPEEPGQGATAGSNAAVMVSNVIRRAAPVLGVKPQFGEDLRLMSVRY